MAWDVVIIFACLVLLLLSDQGFMRLSTLVYNFLKAIVFIKIWSVIWQFRFNMQTDVYYIVANRFLCRNLLGDAQTYIKNVASRFTRRIEKVDMSSTSEKEMRAIRWYALLYFFGTLVTLATYFFRSIPLLLLQVVKAFNGITSDYTANPKDFIDAVVLIGLNAFNYGLLAYLILRPRWSGLKQRVRAMTV